MSNRLSAITIGLYLIGILFFLESFFLMLYFYLFYALFGLKLVIVTFIFILYVILSFAFQFSEGKPLREREKLMSLKMQNYFGTATFLISVSIPFIVVSDITKNWANVVSFIVGITMLLIGLCIWFKKYTWRYTKLEQHYHKRDNSDWVN